MKLRIYVNLFFFDVESDQKASTSLARRSFGMPTTPRLLTMCDVRRKTLRTQRRYAALTSSEYDDTSSASCQMGGPYNIVAAITITLLLLCLGACVFCVIRANAFVASASLALVYCRCILYVKLQSIVIPRYIIASCEHIPVLPTLNVWEKR